MKIGGHHTSRRNDKRSADDNPPAGTALICLRCGQKKAARRRLLCSFTG